MDVIKMFKSFRFAFLGIFHLIKYENNAKIHLLASFLVISLGLYLHISETEWLGIWIALGLVWSAEAFNTAIEKICDFIHPTHNQKIGVIKDLSAAGVLFVSFSALMVALIVFLPKFF